MNEFNESINHMGLPDEIRGMPSLNLDEMIGSSVPKDWEIEQVLGDTIMIEFVDENEHGEVLRDGIWLKLDVSKNVWRVGKVLKVGPSSSGNVKVDDLIMFPSNRGIPMIDFKKRKIMFLNEERIFAIVSDTTGQTK